ALVARSEPGPPGPDVAAARSLPPRIRTPLEPLARSRRAVRPTSPRSSVCHSPRPSAAAAQDRGRVRAARGRRVPRPDARLGAQSGVLLHGARDARGRRRVVPGPISSSTGRPGSAVRATYADVQGHGAEPVVIGALLVMGSAASPYFAERGVSIEAVTRVPFDLWVPAECPLCASGEALEDP